MYVQYLKQDYHIPVPALGRTVETQLDKQVFITRIGGAYRLSV